MLSVMHYLAYALLAGAFIIHCGKCSENKQTTKKNLEFWLFYCNRVFFLHSQTYFTMEGHVFYFRNNVLLS